MQILMRSQGSKGEWRVAEKMTPGSEQQLQRLLLEWPRLVPVEEIREGLRPLIVAVREVALPGSGYADALAFTADGDIAVIECKLSGNQEVKRKVIGQILEYAAFLWQMSYEDLDGRVAQVRGAGLLELVAEATKDEEWDAEAFRQNVTASLKSGTFLLLIVVDEINDELARTIRYVNERGTSGFTLHALEVRRFSGQGVEVLVPHLHGAAPAVPPRGPHWSEATFFEKMVQSADPTAVSLARDLYQWGSGLTGSNIYFGTGAQTASFSLQYRRGDRLATVFSVYSSGRLTISYGSLDLQLSQELLQQFHSRIVAIPSLKDIPADFNMYPSRMLSQVLKAESDLAAFKRSVEWLGEQIRANGASAS